LHVTLLCFLTNIIIFLNKFLILKVWIKAVDLKRVLMPVYCRNAVQMGVYMSWSHVCAVICSELFNHCHSHNLNNNGTVPVVLLVQLPG